MKLQYTEEQVNQMLRVLNDTPYKFSAPCIQILPTGQRVEEPKEGTPEKEDPKLKVVKKKVK